MLFQNMEYLPGCCILVVIRGVWYIRKILTPHTTGSQVGSGSYFSCHSRACVSVLREKYSAWVFRYMIYISEPVFDTTDE